MKKFSLLILLVIVSVACRTAKTPKNNSTNSQNEVSVTFLHLNDVYEISPLDNGKVGGMARVATVRQDLLKENPNEDAGKIIATLIIERQLQKIKYKSSSTAANEDDCDEEKW